MDYHAQLQIVAKGLKAAQDKLEGMEIRPPWLRGSFRLYTFLVPIAFFMGDTPAHDKLCCIKNHQKADFICRLCNVPRTKLLLYVAHEWMMVYSTNTVTYHLLGISRILSTVHFISILENY